MKILVCFDRSSSSVESASYVCQSTHVHGLGLPVTIHYEQVRSVAQCLVGASLELHVSRSTKYLDDVAFLITPRCPAAVMQADCTLYVRVVSYDVVYHLDDVPYFVGGLLVVEDDQAPQLCSSSCILAHMPISAMIDNSFASPSKNRLMK